MESPSGVRPAWRVVGSVARTLLLVTLLWGAILVALSTVAAEGTPEQLRTALHRPDTVVLVKDTGELRWSTGPLGWRSLYPDGRAAMDAALAAAEERGVTVVRADRDRWPPEWFEDVPARHGVLVPLAWSVTLLVMLARSRPRYATRWGWFWLFTVGGVGALLYLVMEPQPIWRALDDPLPPGGSRLDGVGAFLVAFAVAVVTGVGFFGVASLFG
ncbi:hypothetical protein [Nonomuraea sp. NPDC003754]